MAHGSSNPTTDLKKIKGTDVDVNTGAASAGTQRVILATDQSTVPVSLSSAPLPTGAATEATLASRLSESDFDSKVGSLTEAAPANDTASSGLNGRLQRIAQRITSLIALLPTALGQGTMATSFKVVLPSDQSTIPVSVASVPSHAVTNAGTFAVQDSEKLTDNAAFTDGTTKVQPGGYIYDDVAGTALSENDVAAARIDSKRAQVMVLEDGTTRTRTAKVLAASTAAVAADPAIVVAVSPNNTPVLPNGAATETTLATLTSQSTFSTLSGAVTEAAPANDTASSGLNGRLQRIAQRITSLIALVPASLGAKTSANSFSVVLASDQAAIPASQSGTWSTRVLGNAGATLDSTVGPATAPTNALAVAGLYNNTPPAPTTGQALAKQLDQAGNTRMAPSMAMATLSGWTSATALNATQTIYTNHGAPAVLVHLVQTSTISGGAVTFEVSYDGTNWVTIPSDAVFDPSTTVPTTISLPYTLVASTNKPFLLVSKGWQSLRIKLSTAITGTATVTPNYALLPTVPESTLDVHVSGTVAHDSVDVGSPVKIGAKTASAYLPTYTPLTAGDRTDLYADLDGVLLTKPYATGGDIVNQSVSVSATGDNAISNFGATSGVFNYITSIQIANTGTASPVVLLKNGSGGTTLAAFAAPPGGGCNVHFPVPLRMAANTALYWAVSATPSGTVYLSLQGFRSKV